MSDSPPVQLILVVWDNANRVTGHSWRRLNWSLKDALCLAIHSGMRFDRPDLSTIASRFRGSYWMGDPEFLYSLAVRDGNRSAAISLERWIDRKPFILKSGKRVCVGSTLWLEGNHYRVTSLKKDYLVACLYDYSEPEEPDRNILVGKKKRSVLAKVRKRLRLSHKDVKGI